MNPADYDSKDPTSAQGQQPTEAFQGFPYDAAAIDRARTLLDEVPEQIGPYRILERLGFGGMGEVYRAEQRTPIRREVALKVIKLGMDTKQVMARFEAERQALALMDHPHIAKVFDAATDEAGRPYFVMEYVKGKPITEYADLNHLNIPERLELFSQVCQAIQHAHQKGVIHRDVKPSNILVSTQDGKPYAKVIDFGIAKATAQQLTDKTLFTRHDQFIGTPQYMSPEQAAGSLDIDTRSDVYSLGVLLYELLTGQPPFDSKALGSAAYAEIVRILREVDPPKPSTRLATINEQSTGKATGGDSPSQLSNLAKARSTDASQLMRQVRGELDWMVMMAMEKDRSRRYETPTALADDVRRYLDGSPVKAAPPSAWYRTKKFVRKHKGPVAAGGILATVLIAATAIFSGMAWKLNEEGKAKDVALEREQQALVKVEKGKDSAEWDSYIANIALAQTAMNTNNWPEARRRLDACPEAKRGWEWKFLLRQANVIQCTIPGYWQNGAFSSDGTRLALAHGDSVQFFTTQGIPISENIAIEPAASHFQSMRFDSETGNLLCNQRGVLYCIDGDDYSVRRVLGTELECMSICDSGVECVALDPSETPQFQRFSTRDGSPIGAPVTSLQEQQLFNSDPWNRDGFSFDRNFSLIQTSNASWLWSWKDHKSQRIDRQRGQSISFNRFGNNLVISSLDGKVDLIEPYSMAKKTAYVFPRNFVSCAVQGISPTNSMSIVANDEAWIYSSDYHPLAALDGLFSSPLANCIHDVSCDRKQILLGYVEMDYFAHAHVMNMNTEGSAVTWIAPKNRWPDLSNDAELARLIIASELSDGQNNISDDAVLSWDANLNKEGQIIITDRTSKRQSTMIEVFGKRLLCLAISGDGKSLVSSEGNSVRFYDTTTWREVAVIEADPTQVKRKVVKLDFHPDSQRLFVHFEDGTAQLWDVRPIEVRRAVWAQRANELAPAHDLVEKLIASDVSLEQIRQKIVKDSGVPVTRRCIALTILDAKCEMHNGQASKEFDRLADVHFFPEEMIEPAEKIQDPLLRKMILHRIVQDRNEINTRASFLCEDTWQMLCDYEVSDEQLAKATRNMELLLKADPESDEIKQCHALLLLRQGKLQEAYDAMKVFFIPEEKNVDGDDWAAYALIQGELGMRDEAGDSLRKLDNEYLDSLSPGGIKLRESAIGWLGP